MTVASLQGQQLRSSDPTAVRCSNALAWELVDRVRDGDETAFSTLYVSHIDAVFSYVLARTRDWANAEEITSEAFLRAFRAIHTLTYRGTSFRSWVMAIARDRKSVV